MLRNSDHSWGALTKLLHWVVAVLIFMQFVLGWVAVSWRLSPTKIDLFVWHKSLGVLVLLLVVLRIVWRLANPTPGLPDGTPHWERRAAYASHLLMYVLIIALPVSGWVINSAANIPFRIFWLVPLPDITPPDKALAALAKQVHLTLFVALAIALVLHIGAALRHHFVKRTDVLARMLPGKRDRA